MKRVYLDCNATVPLREEVRKYWIQAMERVDGNPSSLHSRGRVARLLIDEARDRTARALGVDEEEIVFTSGATEANNLALFGCMEGASRGGKRNVLATTAVEHSSVLEPAQQIATRGYPVDFIPVERNGLPIFDCLLERVRSGDCAVLSLMASNNETGARMPLEALGRELATLDADRRPLFHSDAVQALGKGDLQLREWGIDVACFSAHKVGGPPGVGVLYRRRGTPIEPLMFGGGQEGGLRPGTENAAALAAASIAIELAVSERLDLNQRLAALEQALWTLLRASIPDCALTGPQLGCAERTPGTLNVLIPKVDGKVLVTRLDLAGLEASAGSACASGSIQPSHVLLAMGYCEDEARSGLRLSLGRTTTLADVELAVEILGTTLG